MNLDELTEALLDEAEPVLKSKKDILFKPTFVAISSPPGYNHFEHNFPKDPSSATAPGYNYNGVPLAAYYKYVQITKQERILGDTRVEYAITLDPSHSTATATTFAATVTAKAAIPTSSYYGYSSGKSWNLNIGGYSPGNLALRISQQHKKKFNGKNGFIVGMSNPGDAIAPKIIKTILLKRGGVALDIQKALYALAKEAEEFIREIVQSIIDTITTDNADETAVELAGEALAETFEQLKFGLVKLHTMVSSFDKVKIPRSPKEFAVDMLSPESAGHWVNVIDSFKHVNGLSNEVKHLATMSDKLNAELLSVHTALKKLVAEA